MPELKLLFGGLNFTLGAKPWRREELRSHACQGGDAMNFGVCLFIFRIYLCVWVCINIICVRQTTLVSCLMRVQRLTWHFLVEAMHIY